MNAIVTLSLSPRERECLRLVSQGLTSKQIGAQLNLTPDTVDGYLKTAMRKLGVSDRKAAARLVASEEGLVPQWLGEPPAGGGGTGSHAPTPSAASDGVRAAIRLPLRRRGERNNNLDLLSRLLWIPVIAAVGAMAFGMMSVGLKVWSDLVGSSPLLYRQAKQVSDRDDHHIRSVAEHSLATQSHR